MYFAAASGTHHSRFLGILSSRPQRVRADRTPLTCAVWLLWQIRWLYFVCHTKMEFLWQTSKLLPICHKIKVGSVSAWPMAAILCGKFGGYTSFATRKWNPCGKLASHCRFATRLRLAQSALGQWPLYCVANSTVILSLPHENGILVAN